MAQTNYYEDRTRSQAFITWPLAEPMTFYVLRREDGSVLSPFVRRFDFASQQASQERAKGVSVVMEQWEWRDQYDEAEFVGIAANVRALGGPAARSHEHLLT